MSQYERTIHLPVINSGVFLFSPEGFYSGRSPGVGFGLPQLLPSERCFLCWYPAMNPIFLLRLLMGHLWRLTKSMDQEELYGDLDVEILFLSSRRVIFILCTCILAERCFPGRFTTSQSLSTCRVCSWQEFSGILEFLEGIWKNFQTDRRQRQHSEDVARSHLIVTCNSSLAYVSTQSAWPTDALKQHPAVPSNRQTSLKKKNFFKNQSLNCILEHGIPVIDTYFTHALHRANGMY